MIKAKNILYIFAIMTALSLTACQSGEEKKTAVPEKKAEENAEVADAKTADTKTEDETEASQATWLPSWKEEGIKNQIMDFVTAAVDENSDAYIPPEDRIVVTDIDGTLIAEKGIKVNNNEMVLKSPKEAREYFISIQDNYFDEEKKIKYKELLYQPMKEMYEYLAANDFEIYFVSGNCNSLTYALANYFFDADYAHSIGSNVTLEIKEKKNKYDVVPTGDFEGSWCEVKCYRIYNQIGKRPVLAFGNSDGDVQMLRWVGANPDYSSLSVMINHDDEREYVYSVDEITGYCDDYGFLNGKISENFESIYVQ